MKKAKPKKCKVCKELFVPFSSLAKACSVTCSLKLIRTEKQKEFNRETRRLKETIKTRTVWYDELQVQVNRYVRLRDSAKPCCTCGLTLNQAVLVD